VPNLVWLFVLLPCAVCVHQEQTIQQLEQRIASFQSDSALSGAESGVSNRVAALHDRFQNQEGTNRLCCVLSCLVNAVVCVRADICERKSLRSNVLCLWQG